MADLKTTHQHPGGVTSGDTPPGTQGEDNQGAEFGAREQATRGTNRDADAGGESANQGHGHPKDRQRG